jgi:4,5-dihydroxyphthalate decarboxylase
MAPLKLKLACASYDRMMALRTGDVKPDGIDLDVIAIEHVREIFDRMGATAEFDLAEFSSTEYIGRIGSGDRTFVALPVFPSRVFRHGFIFVNCNRIAEPKDLEGKRIGTALYTQTAALWIRGMLGSEHGVDLSGVTWVQGAVQVAGAHGSPSPPPLLKPPRIEINYSGRSLDEMLDAGEIDAVIGTRVPACYRRNKDIVRLFPAYWEVERDYYRRTGVHPIMHLVAMRREVHEAHPWAAAAMYKAFAAAKEHALAMLRIEVAPRYLLPWLQRDIEEMDEVFGADPWPYGVEANRPTLEALMRYMVEQHYIARPIPLQELFVGEGP